MEPGYDDNKLIILRAHLRWGTREIDRFTIRADDWPPTVERKGIVYHRRERTEKPYSAKLTECTYFEADTDE